MRGGVGVSGVRCREWVDRQFPYLGPVRDIPGLVSQVVRGSFSRSVYVGTGLVGWKACLTLPPTPSVLCQNFQVSAVFVC